MKTQSLFKMQARWISIFAFLFAVNALNSNKSYALGCTVQRGEDFVTLSDEECAQLEGSASAEVGVSAQASGSLQLQPEGPTPPPGPIANNASQGGSEAPPAEQASVADNGAENNASKKLRSPILPIKRNWEFTAIASGGQRTGALSPHSVFTTGFQLCHAGTGNKACLVAPFVAAGPTQAGASLNASGLRLGKKPNEFDASRRLRPMGFVNADLTVGANKYTMVAGSVTMGGLYEKPLKIGNAGDERVWVGGGAGLGAAVGNVFDYKKETVTRDDGTEKTYYTADSRIKTAVVGPAVYATSGVRLPHGLELTAHVPATFNVLAHNPKFVENRTIAILQPSLNFLMRRQGPGKKAFFTAGANVAGTVEIRDNKEVKGGITSGIQFGVAWGAKPGKTTK